MHKSLRDYCRRCDVDYTDDEQLRCHVCGGRRGLLGVLGSLAHYQCRDCGIDSSERVDVDEEPADWTNERD